MKYYNPEPNGLRKDDCTIRSIVVVTGWSYQSVRRKLNAFKKVTHAKQYYSNHNPHHFVEDVLEAQTIAVDKNMTVADFCRKHPEGRFILDLPSHWVAVIGTGETSDFWDTWDCSNEIVNFAYEIPPADYTLPDRKKQVFKYCCTSERISHSETRIKIYDGLGTHVERIIPTELTAGYVLCLQHNNYRYIDLD